MKKLFVIDVDQRLGSKNDAIEIKNHVWFSSINFNDLYNKKIKPLWKPTLTHPTDVK